MNPIAISPGGCYVGKVILHCISPRKSGMRYVKNERIRSMAIFKKRDDW